jgi:hypothetical protein
VSDLWPIEEDFELEALDECSPHRPVSRPSEDDLELDRWVDELPERDQ